MAEYVEREAVLSLAKDICVLTKWDSEYRHRSIDPGDVRELPAADVAPVVRCKDCEIQQYCKVAQYLGADGFCSNGVRMDGGET